MISINAQVYHHHHKLYSSINNSLHIIYTIQIITTKLAYRNIKLNLICL